jgi:hypothetical protein
MAFRCPTLRGISSESIWQGDMQRVSRCDGSGHTCSRGQTREQTHAQTRGQPRVRAAAAACTHARRRRRRRQRRGLRRRGRRRRPRAHRSHPARRRCRQLGDAARRGCPSTRRQGRRRRRPGLLRRLRRGRRPLPVRLRDAKTRLSSPLAGLRAEQGWLSLAREATIMKTIRHNNEYISNAYNIWTNVHNNDKSKMHQ